MENIMGEIFAVKLFNLLFYGAMCERHPENAHFLLPWWVGVDPRHDSTTLDVHSSTPRTRGLNQCFRHSHWVGCWFIFGLSFISSYEWPLTLPYLFNRENNSYCFISYCCMPAFLARWWGEWTAGCVVGAFQRDWRRKGAPYNRFGMSFVHFA